MISTNALFTSKFDPAYALLALIAASLATYAVLFRTPRDRFSAAELAQFENDGYVVVRRLADPVTCAIMLAKARLDLAAGMAPDKILKSIQTGFGDALGFIAVVLGLGDAGGDVVGGALEAGCVADALGSAETDASGDEATAVGETTPEG